MRSVSTQDKRARAWRLPRELTTIASVAVAVFAVVATGSMILAALPQPVSPWLFASAYLAPASIAFTVYWWLSQRL